MIHLAPVTSENLDVCVRLKVEPNQQRFVATNVFSLAQAYVNPDTAHPYAIYNDEEMVGFAMLGIDDKIKEYEIWRFMIDSQFQGKGYGRAALVLLIDHMKSRGVHELYLDHAPDNDAAAHLYGSAGFEPCGYCEDGSVLRKLTLSLKEEDA